MQQLEGLGGSHGYGRKCLEPTELVAGWDVENGRKDSRMMAQDFSLSNWGYCFGMGKNGERIKVLFCRY